MIRTKETHFDKQAIALREKAAMKTKITVIGAGNVGSTIAFMISVKHTADEVVIVDINEERAKGEAMDIRQGAPLTAQPVSVYAGNYESTAGSDIVIITSGIPRKPGQTRMDLAQTNVNVSATSPRRLPNTARTPPISSSPTR